MTLDDVCSEVAKDIERSAARLIAEEVIPQCCQCDFLAVIRLDPFDDGWAKRIEMSLPYILRMSLSSISDSSTEHGHYFEFDLSDKDVNEDYLLRLAGIISNALMVKENSEGYLTLDIYRHARNKKSFVHEYSDFATDCAPLQAERLAAFLKIFAETKVTIGCIKVIGVDMDWK